MPETKPNRIFTTTSGVELPLVPVPQLALANVYADLASKKPNPPLETSESGLQIPNEAHPDYLAAMAEYSKLENDVSQACLVEYAVDIELTQEQRKQVARLKRIAEKFGYPTDLYKFDVYIFVTMVAITDATDVGKLYQAIQEVSFPSQAEVAAHRALFQSDLSGTGHIQDNSPEVWATGEPSI